MDANPRFPDFAAVRLADRPVISPILQSYGPVTSELTFTNMFIWRGHYGLEWSLWQDLLLLLCRPRGAAPFFLPPVGPGPRREAVRELFPWFGEHLPGAQPVIARADQRLADELATDPQLVIEPQREHFDYVYATADLVSLAGRKYHGKKNHVNKFRSSYSFRYEAMMAAHIQGCLEFQDTWCDCNRCREDMNLMQEWEAVREVLAAFDELQVRGGVVFVDNRIEAFTIGELLNSRTAVVHIEKANAQLPGLYSFINQQFCEHAWSGVPLVNREQDLGDEGLRQAKLSYHPQRLEPKYRITLAQ